MADKIGQQINNSKEIEDLIQSLVTKTMEFNRNIDGLREPTEEGTTHLNELCEEIHQLRGRPLFYPYVGSGAGNAAYVELEDGSVKVDLINGIGINILGHSHPKILEASIRGALQDVVMQGNLEPNLQYKDISKKLLSLASKGTKLKHVWLSTCGTMANENALKMARQKNSPAKMIVALKNAFAGRSTLMAEVTDNPAYKVGLPTYDDVLRVDYYNAKDSKSTENSLRQLKEHVANHSKDIACFSFEPMQGEGGYRVAPRDFYLPLLEFCKEQGIAVWADEVQTFCRSGELLAIQKNGNRRIGRHCFGCKSICRVELHFIVKKYNPQPGLIAGTFSGSSAALSAGIAVLEELSENNYFGPQGKIQEIHDFFVDGLNMLATTTCEGLIHEPGGMGLMVAFTPHDGTKEKMLATIKACFKNGLITFGCGRDPYRIRFLIPASTTKKQLEEALRVIDTSLNETK